MSTPAQRHTIRSLLRAAEFDLSRLTLQHTRMPNCTRQQVGQPVDTWIDGLAASQASDVISWLQKEVA